MAHAHDLKIPRNVKWENISTSWQLICLKTPFFKWGSRKLVFFTIIFFQNNSLDGDPLPLARKFFLKVLLLSEFKNLSHVFEKNLIDTLQTVRKITTDSFAISSAIVNNRQWLRWRRVLKMEKIMIWWPFWMPGHNTER